MREVPLVVYENGVRRVIGDAKVWDLENGDVAISGRVLDSKDFPGYDKMFKDMRLSIAPSLPVPEVSYSVDAMKYIGGTGSYVVPNLPLSDAEKQAQRYAMQMLELERQADMLEDYYRVRKSWHIFKNQFDGTYLETLVREAFDAIYNPS